MRSTIRWHKFFALGAMVLALSMAACGVTSTANDGSGVAATATASGTMPGKGGLPTATVAGLVTCPITTQVVSWPTRASAELSPAQPNATVKVGQSLEVVLPINAGWHFTPSAATSILQLQQPAGYFDAARQSCIWRFNAQTKGTANLTYTRTARCVPGTKCSQVAMALPLTVTVD